MYQALYRKYRPQTFDDVVGQSAVTQTLKTQLQSGKLSHAYLFTGSRGTGKTSIAKILAKAVNCTNPQNGNPCNCCDACRAIDSGSCMDVLEIDAASNNGVDNVRDLRDDAIYTPSQVKMRVYIIDEVHMLSIAAFNALLKIIEEPPKHLLFILATTELHKVPATILSRCQRFSFRRISPEDIASRLQYVAYQEDINMDTSAARVLARLADGAMRDGLSLLDQCAAATSGELNAQAVCACLGIAGIQQCGQLMDYISQHDTTSALNLLNRLYADGKDMGALMDELICLTRDLMILKTAPNAGVSMLSGVADDKEVAALSSRFSSGELVRMMNVIQQTLVGFTRSASRRVDAELCVVKLCQPELDCDVESLLARLTRIEDCISGGSFVCSVPQKVVGIPQPTVSETIYEPENELQPEPECEDAQEIITEDQTPAGFWPDLVAALKPDLSPVLKGFFITTPNAPLRGVLTGDKLTLVCENKFVEDIVNKPDVLSLIALKASARLGRQIRVVTADQTSNSASNGNMEQLLNFGRAHSDIIKIKDC